MKVLQLPNGCSLFRQRNSAGGYDYISDEVGGGVYVWNTALVDESTLIAALYAEQLRRIEELNAGSEDRSEL